MNRRDFNKWALTAASVVMLPSQSLACGGGCIGTTVYKRFNPQNTTKDIETLMNQHYKNWLYSNQKCVSIKAPAIAENGAVVPVSLELSQLPEGAIQCQSLALIVRYKLNYVQRTIDGKYINLKSQAMVTRYGYLEDIQVEKPVLSLRCRLYTKSDLYVAGEFKMDSGDEQIRTLLFKSPQTVKVVTKCSYTAFYEQLET